MPLGFQGWILADIGASDGGRLHTAGYCFQERGFPTAVFSDKEGQRVSEIQTFQGSDTGNVEGKNLKGVPLCPGGSSADRSTEFLVQLEKFINQD